MAVGENDLNVAARAFVDQRVVSRILVGLALYFFISAVGQYYLLWIMFPSVFDALQLDPLGNLHIIAALGVFGLIGLYFAKQIWNVACVVAFPTQEATRRNIVVVSLVIPIVPLMGHPKVFWELRHFIGVEWGIVLLAPLVFFIYFFNAISVRIDKICALNMLEKGLLRPDFSILRLLGIPSGPASAGKTRLGLLVFILAIILFGAAVSAPSAVFYKSVSVFQVSSIQCELILGTRPRLSNNFHASNVAFNDCMRSLAFPQLDFLLTLALTIIVLMVSANYLVKFGRYISRTSFEQMSKHDHRPPIVFLRPFGNDQVALTTDRTGVFNAAMSFGQARGCLDHILIEDFSSVGPVVAIGNPKDTTLPYGAARYYAENEDWQTKVADFMRCASAIVIVADDSAGVQWELDTILSDPELRRKSIIFRNPSRDIFEGEPKKWSTEGLGEFAMSWPKETLCSHASPLSSGAVSGYVISNKEIAHDAVAAGRSVA